MSCTHTIELNPLAEAANEIIRRDCPVVYELLSERGKRFFFPTKGILAQGAEARQKAKTTNATIGIATENGAPMYLDCVNKYFNGLTSSELYDYAPSCCGHREGPHGRSRGGQQTRSGLRRRLLRHVLRRGL